MKLTVEWKENPSEEELVEWLKSYLDFGEIVNDDFPAKGASSWYPYGYSIIKNILQLASFLIKNIGFEEIVLPSFVHGEDFMKECRDIKDFSERVYWSPLYKEDDLHVVTPTIEAQLGSLYAKWLSQGKRLPFKYFTIRGVGRYETGKTIPLWKERNVWPFFEGLTAHNKKTDFTVTIRQQVSFMKTFFKTLGIPVLIIERPKISRRLKEYSEKRIEAITITKDKRVVILANIYDLGEIFSKVYDITYSIKNAKYYALTSAIGLSGRVLATLLAINGDRDGFVIPPSIAPILVAIVPIYEKAALHKMSNVLKNYLSKNGISSEVFNAKSSLGERRRKIVAMGVPFLMEVGKEEIRSSMLHIKQRGFSTTIQTKIKNLPRTIKVQSKILEKAIKTKTMEQFNLLNRSAKSKEEFLHFVEDEFLTKAPFCDKPFCYEKAAECTGKEIIGRAYNIILNDRTKCVNCGKSAVQSLYFGVKWKGEK